MPNRDRREKMEKRDQSLVREVEQILDEELPKAQRSAPLRPNPNRDRARGDWDRTSGGNREMPPIDIEPS